MMKASLNYKNIHPKFKLNGVSYGFDELKEVAYSLIKEGIDHEQLIGDFLIDWLDQTSDLVVKTSGSTGTPKTIPLKKQHMVNSAIATGTCFDLQAGNTSLLCLPTQYIAGKMMLVRAMVLGLELDYLAPSSNPMEHIQKEYDFCAMVPFQLQNCMAKIEQIRTLLVGGAPLSMQLKKQVQHKSTQIFETYGMTETITHVAVKKINSGASRSSLRPRQGGAVETSVDRKNIEKYYSFKALPNVIFSIDERDCLVLDAPKIASETIITNDIVKLISETEFEWLGRFDNVINSGGVKLFPELIEAKLAPFLKHSFFVAGMPDEEFDQRLVLVIEGDTDLETILREIRENGSLERFEIPTFVYSLPNFIRTDTDKIRRKETLKQIIG